ncbi:hypothetical protein GS231_002351 [Salmonella enterica]|nr:hypothetical protein [Salmonella enterica]
MTIENACASLSSQKTGWHDKKWTKWSNFTLKQQKTTIKIHLIAINYIKCIKIQNYENQQQKHFKNQYLKNIKNKTNTSKNRQKQQIKIM